MRLERPEETDEFFRDCVVTCVSVRLYLIVLCIDVIDSLLPVLPVASSEACAALITFLLLLGFCG